MNRRTENERFCVWQGRRSRPSEDGRWSLTPSRRRKRRLNAESFCVGALRTDRLLNGDQTDWVRAFSGLLCCGFRSIHGEWVDRVCLTRLCQKTPSGFPSGLSLGVEARSGFQTEPSVKAAKGKLRLGYAAKPSMIPSGRPVSSARWPRRLWWNTNRCNDGAHPWLSHDDNSCKPLEPPACAARRLRPAPSFPPPKPMPTSRLPRDAFVNR